jgi:hypothetical protein
MFLPERKAKRGYVDENFGRMPTIFPDHKTNSLKNLKFVLLKKLTVFLYLVLCNSFSSKRGFLKFVALIAIPNRSRNSKIFCCTLDCDDFYEIKMKSNSL